MVPSGGPVFGPFILSDVLKLCKLLCAQNVKLEANDPRRLRKKPQDAQDDVTELFDLFDARFGVGKTTKNLDSQRRSLPSSACGCLSSFLPLWFHGFWRTFEAAGCVPSVMSQSQKQDCHTLQRVDLARPFLISLVTKIELKTASKWPCLK